MRRNRPQLRVGLQLKSALVLTFVVITVTATAGWFYFALAHALLRENDRHRAVRMAEALALAARKDLKGRNDDKLQELLNEAIVNKSYLSRV